MRHGEGAAGEDRRREGREQAIRNLEKFPGKGSAKVLEQKHACKLEE